MALPASGAISLNQVNVELGNSGTAQIGMNDADVRGLFGIASGEIEMADGYGQSNVAWYGERGVWAGGYASNVYQNVMGYVTIATTGNASDFGDLLFGTESQGTASDGSRGVIAGGYKPTVHTSNEIQYFTFATTGNCVDFGDLLSKDMEITGLSNGTRGGFAGGRDRAGYRGFTQVISYVTIATTGNAASFGNLISQTSTHHYASMGGVCNGTRGVFAGGSVYNFTNIIQYITVDTTSNASDFGDLTTIKGSMGSASGGDRGVFAAGYYQDTAGYNLTAIDYISIPTTGNASDFGDMITASKGSGCSDNSRGVFNVGHYTGTLEYITISNTGNASDFGDLTISPSGSSALAGT